MDDVDNFHLPIPRASSGLAPRALPVTSADVGAARERIRDWVWRTPLVPSPWLSDAAGRPVLLKLENRQETGSFKARGALNVLLQLTPDEKARGVVTASAGNHGQAVAWAAARLGIAATIVLPRDAVAVKVERTRSWGGTVVRQGQGYDEAHTYAEDLAARTRAIYIPAFDHPAVIAGQGTLALEIFEQDAATALLVVPVGGGGLIGGVAIAAADHPAHPRVLGVQSGNTAAMHDALQAGRLTPVETPPTLADGLAGEVCQTTLDVCRALGVPVALVPEETLLLAMGETLAREHLAIEGSAAVAVAAVLASLIPPGGTPVALVLTGGNVDPDVLRRAVDAMSKQA